MSENIVLTLIELFVGITFEGIILGFLFQWIANKETEKHEQMTKAEMKNIEKQMKHNFDALKLEIFNSRNDLINQIKETGSEKK